MNLSSERLFQRYGLFLAMASAFLAPLKLAPTYCTLIPLILLWLARPSCVMQSLRRTSRWSGPLILFLFSLAVSAIFGIDPPRSLRGVFTLGFYLCTTLVFYEMAIDRKFHGILWCLLGGQTLASFYSIFEAASSFKLPRLFQGEVTESGQLALTTLIALGFLVYSRRAVFGGTGDAKPQDLTDVDPANQAALWGIMNFTLGCLIAFSPYLALGGLLFPVVIPLFGASLAAAGLSAFRLTAAAGKSGRNWPAAWPLLLCGVVLPILTVALLANLKRGPWAGVMIGTTIFLALFARRLILCLIVFAAAAFLLFQPLQARLAQSSRDFSIAGGRGVIWRIGAELSTRYPLGVGFRNSPFLRNFSPEIPPQLKHFHSNILNILVENGWISLGLYFWWLYMLLRQAFLAAPQSRFHPLIVGAACAVISWQSAGLVEYNFGDSEVLIVALILIGILGRLFEDGEKSPNQTA